MKLQRKAPFKHQGGKGRLLSHILPLIGKHECYCEPFCGSAAVFFNKPDTTAVEVINDIEGEVANCFRCLQRHCDAVIQEMHLAVNSRQHFIELRDAVGLTDIQRAARFLTLRALSFGADGVSFGVQRKSGGGAATNMGSLLRDLDRFHRRLQGVIVENLPYDRCLRTYDSPQTVFYLDPPYIGGNQCNYRSWTIKEVTDLSTRLDGTKGRWILSMNDRPEVRQLFRGRKMKAFARQRGIANGGKNTPYHELLIWN